MDDHPPRGTTPRLPVVALGGLLMGAADIVPGVSGGTVALLLGIYERLVANVRAGAAVLGSLVRGRWALARERILAVEWVWLVTLGAGIVGAVLLLTDVIEHQLEVNPIAMSGLFLGLVAGSVVIAAGDVHDWANDRLLFAGVAALATFLLLGLRPATIADPGPAVFFVAGAIAICAMILPGVSGSFLLLTMGMYEPLLDVIDARDVARLGGFLLGATIGLASFSTVLAAALARWHDQMLAVLVGLMIGSIRVLWPWPADEGVGDTRLGAPGDDVLAAVGLAVVGLGVVLLVARIARRQVGAPDELAPDPAGK